MHQEVGDLSALVSMRSPCVASGARLEEQSPVRARSQVRLLPVAFFQAAQVIYVFKEI